MRQISCSHLGCCDEVITARDDAELKQKLFDHAKTKHAESFRTMTPEMVTAVEQKMRQYAKTV